MQYIVWGDENKENRNFIFSGSGRPRTSFIDTVSSFVSSFLHFPSSSVDRFLSES